MRLLRIFALVALCLAYAPMPALAVTGFDSAYSGESAFVNLNPGDTASFQVFFTNTGTMTWTKGSATQVDLAACFADKVTCPAQDPTDSSWNNGWLSTTRYATTAQATVAPGAIATFAYNIKAPADATGTHRFNGDLVVSSSGALIHPEGYYQDATINAIGNIPLPPQGNGGGGGGGGGGGQNRLGTLTVNDGNVATGCPGPNFPLTFRGSGLAPNTAYNLSGMQTAPSTSAAHNVSVTTDGAGTFTLTQQSTGALAPTSYSFVVTSGDEQATNSVTVNMVCNPSVADLSVTKSDSPDPVHAGSNITYTITVKNAGPSDAVLVSLTDATPANTTFVSLTAPAGWTIQTPAVGATGLVSASKATLSNTSGPQVFTFVVRVNANTPTQTSISNTATVGSETNDPDEENDSASATTTVVAGSADLSVTKTDSPDPVLAGNNLTYTITANNAGPDDANLAAITDAIPANTTFVSFTAPAGWTFTTLAVGGTGTVTATKSTFAASSSAVFTLVVKVSSATPVSSTIGNTAAIRSATSDPNGDNNSATATTAVLTSADLSITKSDSPDPVIAGNTITYTLTVNTAGPSDAQNVAVLDTIPANTTFVSFSAPPGWTGTRTYPRIGGEGVVTFTDPTLAAGSVPQVFTIVVRVKPGTADGATITNTATLESATNDPNPANDVDTETTAVIARADLSVTKSGSPDPVIAGNNITYTLVVGNAGPSDAQSVALSDAIPDNTTFVSFTAPGGWTSSTPPVDGTGSVSSTKSTLAAGTSANFTLVVKVASATAPHSTISNTASVTSTTTDPNAENNSATATTSVANPLLCFDGTTDTKNGDTGGAIYDGVCTLIPNDSIPTAAALDNTPSVGSGDYSGVYYKTSSLAGKTLSQVTTLGFDFTGTPTAGSPRISLPVVTTGGTIYAFIGAIYCNDGLGHVDAINDTTCTIFITGGPFSGYPNWAAFATAYPTVTIGTTPFIIADDIGSWGVSNVNLGQ